MLEIDSFVDNLKPRVCVCKRHKNLEGKNVLGNYLMSIRDEE